MDNPFRNAPLLPAGELAAWSGGVWRGGAPAIKGVAHDSRQLAPGALFVALPGGRCDGHAFLRDAARRGAVAAMVRADAECEFAGLPLLCVNDPMAALGRAAQGFRRALGAHIIAVTGSMGKTTVKNFLWALLGIRSPAWGTHGNWNNAIGLPLSVLNMPWETREAVFELGTNRPGEIHALCAMLQPDAAVLTNVAAAHIEHFGTLEAIAQEKADLLRVIPEDGFAVLDRDSKWFGYLRAQARCRMADVSLNPDDPTAVVRARLVNGLEGVMDVFAPELPRQGFRVRTGLPGEHHARNLLMALAAARERGLDWESVPAAVQNAGRAPMRWETEIRGGVTIVNDAYNANPASMRVALDTFARWPAPGGRYLALGDMLELGDQARSEHAGLGRHVAQGEWRRVVMLGDRMRWAFEAALRAGMPASHLCHAGSHAEAAAWLADGLGSGAAVLLKASRGLQFEKLAGELGQRLTEAAG